MSICVCWEGGAGYRLVNTGACGDQKVLDTLELEVVVSHLTWVLETEPKSSLSVASFLNL